MDAKEAISMRYNLTKKEKEETKRVLPNGEGCARNVDAFPYVCRPERFVSV